MATLTPNIGIKKLERGNSYNYQDWNDNYDIMDAEFEKRVKKENAEFTGFLSQNRKAGSVVGTNSTVLGHNCTASGNYSHAEGNSVVASGNNSHAECYYTTAGGTNSHAEGNGTTANGTNSHAEGSATAASGANSHAEGYSTTASGDRSHAEGSSSRAYANYSHAEGSSTAGISGSTTIGVYSHAEGNGAVASGEGAHAEGGSTISSNAYTHAEGHGTTASGTYSHAEGYGTQATGSYSHVEGVYNVATNDAAHAEGGGTAANGNSSHAEGSATKADGSYSHAEGNNTESSGNSSHAEGNGTAASGTNSHAEGVGTVAAGTNSHAGGYYSNAKGNYASFAHGHKATTNVFCGTAFGIGNRLMSGSDAYPGSDSDLFVVGNDTSGAGASDSGGGSNALRLLMNGNVYIAGVYNTGGADYAEFAEWLDGNSNEEDRVGYFVTNVGKKIKIANPGDHIFGIISGNPSIVGNSPEDWQGRWLYDEFGRQIMEDVEITVGEIEEEAEKKTEEEIREGEIKEEEIKEEKKTVMVRRPKENPKYDPTQLYIDRKDRKEWDCVGWIGVLPVRDDGTCQVNGCCAVAQKGIATAAEKGYRVLERISGNVIKIEFVK